MATRPPSQRNFWVFLITLPFWTNLLIRTYAIMLIIRDEGMINDLLRGLGLIDQPIHFLYTNFAILLGLLYSFLPFMVLPIYSSLEKLDFRLVEAGFDLYATRGQVLRRIVIPLAKPGIIAGCVLVFIPALGAYVTPLILGGGKQHMIGSLIAIQFGTSRNWPFGSAQAFILMAVVLLALLLYVRSTTGKARNRPWLTRPYRAARSSIGRPAGRRNVPAGPSISSISPALPASPSPVSRCSTRRS